MQVIESLSWLWVLIGIFGSVAVIVGVWGEEWIEGRVLPFHRQKQLIKWFWITLLTGLAFDLIGLIGSISTSHILENRVGQLRKDSNELQVKFAALNKSTLELAHQYDLSTNALAEANARLQHVGNVAEANSPRNLPIKTISGSGVIGIVGKDAMLFLNALKCPISLELINNESGSAWKSAGGHGTEIVSFDGRIDSARSNAPSQVILKFTVNGERRKTAGIWGNVTFNNAGSVRADFICNNPEPRFVIDGGFLDLTFDSLYDVTFQFSAQTNEIGGEWGVVAVRVGNRSGP